MELGRFSIFIRIVSSSWQIYSHKHTRRSNDIKPDDECLPMTWTLFRSQHAISSRRWLYEKHTKSSNDSLGTGNWQRHPLENLKTARKFFYIALSRSLIRFKMEEWVCSENKSLSKTPPQNLIIIILLLSLIWQRCSLVAGPTLSDSLSAIIKCMYRRKTKNDSIRRAAEFNVVLWVGWSESNIR